MLVHPYTYTCAIASKLYAAFGSCSKIYKALSILFWARPHVFNAYFILRILASFLVVYNNNILCVWESKNSLNAFAKNIFCELVKPNESEILVGNKNKKKIEASERKRERASYNKSFTGERVIFVQEHRIQWNWARVCDK